MKTNTWPTPEELDRLEAMRDKARQTSYYAKHPRLSFDCINLVCNNSSGCVRCRKGHKLSQSISNLVSILAGRTAQICRECIDFNGDDK